MMMMVNDTTNLPETTTLGKSNKLCTILPHCRAVHVTTINQSQNLTVNERSVYISDRSSSCSVLSSSNLYWKPEQPPLSTSTRRKLPGSVTRLICYQHTHTHTIMLTASCTVSQYYHWPVAQKSSKKPDDAYSAGDGLGFHMPQN